MKLFSFLHKKKYLSYTDQVVEATNSNDEPVFLTWKIIKKVVFTNVFEEYSGYFLTDEYKSKSLYDDISINCSHNVVRIRTGSSPTTNRNISKPFSRKFGLTSIYHVVFVEYYDDVGNLNLYAAHYDNEQKNELVADFKQYVKEDVIYFKKIIEGFTPLAQL
jgi:hypothetical protein